MFYSHDILRKNGRFSVIWLSAMVSERARSKYVKKADVLRVNVEKVCEDILDHVVFGKVAAAGPSAKSRQVPFSLYLSGQLMFGVVVVFQQQMTRLLVDIRCLQRSLTTMPTLALLPGDLALELDPEMTSSRAWTTAPRLPPGSFSEFGQLKADETGAWRGDDSTLRLIRELETEHMSIHSARSSDLASDLLSTDDYNARNTVHRDLITMKEPTVDNSLPQLPNHFQVLGEDLEPPSDEFLNMMQRMSPREFQAALEELNLDPNAIESVPSVANLDQNQLLDGAENGSSVGAGHSVSSVGGDHASEAAAGNVTAVGASNAVTTGAQRTNLFAAGTALVTPALVTEMGATSGDEHAPGAPSRRFQAPVPDDVTAGNGTLAINETTEPPSHVYRLPELSESQELLGLPRKRRRRSLVPRINPATQLPKQDMHKMILDPSSLLHTPQENIAKVVCHNAGLESMFETLAMYNGKPSLSRLASDRLNLMHKANCYTRSAQLGNREATGVILEDMPWFMRDPEREPDPPINLRNQMGSGDQYAGDLIGRQLSSKRVRISDEVTIAPRVLMADEAQRCGEDDQSFVSGGRMEVVPEESVLELAGNLSNRDQSTMSSIELGRDRSVDNFDNMERRDSELLPLSKTKEDSGREHSTSRLGTTMNRISEQEALSNSDVGSFIGDSASVVGQIENEQLGRLAEYATEAGGADGLADANVHRPDATSMLEEDPVEAHRKRVEERSRRRKEYMRQKYPDCYSSSSSETSSLSSTARPRKWDLTADAFAERINVKLSTEDNEVDGFLLFSDLCPSGPMGATRVEAAKSFGLLLAMKKSKLVDVEQDEPYGPIIISTPVN